MMFVSLVVRGEAGQDSLVPGTAQLGDVHDGSLTSLQTFLSLPSLPCCQTLHTKKILGAAGPHLIRIILTSSYHGWIFFRKREGGTGGDIWGRIEILEVKTGLDSRYTYFPYFFEYFLEGFIR